MRSARSRGARATSSIPPTHNASRHPQMNANAISAEGLVKVYRSRKSEVRALDGFDLEVPQGTVVGLLGPNGAGKTTAVRILATLLKPDGGHATVAGHDVVREPDAIRKV